MAESSCVFQPLVEPADEDQTSLATWCDLSRLIISEHSYSILKPPPVMQSSNVPSDELDIDHGGGGNETTHLVFKEPSSKKEDSTENSGDPPPVMQLSNLYSDELDIEHGGGGIQTTESESAELPSEAENGLSKNTFDLQNVEYLPDVSSELKAEHAVTVENTTPKSTELSYDENVIANVSNPLSVVQSSELSFSKLDNEHDKDCTTATELDHKNFFAKDHDICWDMQHSNQSNGNLDVSDEDSALVIQEDDEKPPPKKLKLYAFDCQDKNTSRPSTSDDDDEDMESKYKLSDSNGHKSSLSMTTFSERDEFPTGSSNGFMEFDILDEFESNDNDPDEVDSDDSDISLDEIDAMLEAGFVNGNTSTRKSSEHEVKEKVILKVKGRDHFDVLPEGWIEVTHNCGMPIYLHKQTRVCSVSKPYFLGPGSARKHEIPLSAIPCLQYLKELEKEKEESAAIESQEANNGEKKIFPSAKLESVKDNKQSGSLDCETLREYCERRFQFQTIKVKRFKTWSGRRQHQKSLKLKHRPTLPDSTKLITCPLPNAPDKSVLLGNASKREFIMNPCGKSPVCILHEYIQHTLRVQPKYIFKELENASTPYGAVVIINDMEYGFGYGSSKKQAKSDAAKSALEILIPKMKMFTSDAQSDELQDVEFFDEVRVEDPRVCELSVKAGQPYPYQILLECLKR
ncbi:microprocessor complex subunit DGCR8-like [Uloborus diversus]|uniref:microprocessor complex subunit DGCR8-like n=1 Tax=Uloborus diversus TaxID=327109 RepID=UPI00240A95F3|nr:microprocessor complex subunit DGCR8-like [Uloborus diversus]